MQRFGFLLGFLFYVVFSCLCQVSSSKMTFLANRETPSKIMAKREIAGTASSAAIQIYELKIVSMIATRFANTVVTRKVVNMAAKLQTAYFSAILPDDAFVTNFVMEVNGQNYTSYVVTEDEARKQFDSALASGIGSGYVAPSTRDSNVFTISLNVEPKSKAAFYLTYQELLKRKNGIYTNVINIHPGQLVEDLSVEMSIVENRKLKDLKVLSLSTGNEIELENAALDPKANIELVNDTSAIIRFSPSIERQKQLATAMKTGESKGLSAQFTVQYDVERDSTGGEMVIKNCYFINFFAPSGLDSLPKYVVFVLDTSGSMGGTKIKLLKDAMVKILDQLQQKDLFNLVSFSDLANVWNLDSVSADFKYATITATSTLHSNQRAYPANSKYIAAAKTCVNKFPATGGTNALTALKVGLLMVELARKVKADNIDRQPLIIFLTDGIPNSPVKTVIETITAFNTGTKKSSILSLSFGADADKNFLQKLSLQNQGFSKHIYEAKDSALQLENFFHEVSSPLLVNVSFNFDPSQVSKVTKTHFPVLYQGSEIVVSGQCGASKVIEPPQIKAASSKGSVKTKPIVSNSLADVARLWAYVTVKDLLDEKKASDNGTQAIDDKIKEVSKDYSFVTGPTAIVITSPDKPTVVGKEELEDTSRTKPHPKAASPDPNYTRPFISTTPRPVASPLQQKLESDLPWLKDVLDKRADVMYLPKGGFKLGSAEKLSDNPTCLNSVSQKNSTGKCVLLKNCPYAHPLLKSVEVYEKHFCELENQYAGVCCSNADATRLFRTLAAASLFLLLLLHMK